MARSRFLEELVVSESNSDDLVFGKKTHRGAVIGAVLMFLAFASIHLPNTLIIRPHPIFWRVLLGIFSLYAMFITYLLLLRLEDVQEQLRFFDPSLGKELPEILYAEDCRLYTPEDPVSNFRPLMMAVFDIHFVAHFLGWWGKMLIMRDWYVAWICSSVFELCELTFRYWLPNFTECWWDSLLLDLLGCNFIGIILGHYTLKYFGVRKIDWVIAKKEEKKLETSPACDTSFILGALRKL